MTQWRILRPLNSATVVILKLRLQKFQMLESKIEYFPAVISAYFLWKNADWSSPQSLAPTNCKLLRNLKDKRKSSKLVMTSKHFVSTCFCCSAPGSDVSSWTICSWASHEELFDPILSVSVAPPSPMNCPIISRVSSAPIQVTSSHLLFGHVAVPQLFPDASTQPTLLSSPAGQLLTPWFAANDPKSSSFHLRLWKSPHAEPRAEAPPVRRKTPLLAQVSLPPVFCSVQIIFQ